MSITDVHAGGVGPGAWHNELRYEHALENLSTAIAHARRLDADAVVLLGDLTDRGDADSFAAVRRACEGFSGPIRVVGGNHDHALDNRTFEKVFTPDHGDDFRPAVPERIDRFGPVALTGVQIASHDGGATSIGVPLDLAGWPSTLTVLLTHYPVLSLGSQLESHGLRDAGDLANTVDCFAALEQRDDPTLVLNGHLHARHEQALGAVLQLSGAALIELPHEVTVIDVDTDPTIEVTAQRYTVGEGDPERTSLPIMCPSTSRWAWSGSRWKRYADRNPS